MPFGLYRPGELRFECYHDRYQDFPHMFYTKWWPSPTDRMEVYYEYTGEVGAIRRWLKENLPDDAYKIGKNERVVRAVFIRGDDFGLAFKLRWC